MDSDARGGKGGGRAGEVAILNGKEDGWTKLTNLTSNNKKL